MKILIINIDSVIPNLALKKIEKYHKDKGNEVTWDFPLLRDKVDKIYVSCIFSKNEAQCREWEGRAEIGGSGYSLWTKLPPEIETVKPRINLGFTTRGCVRKCEFCIVRAKEGKIKAVGDIGDIWDGASENITLLDNNILALPDHFKWICKQLQKADLKVDFNQGLDIRLVDDEVAQLLSKLKYKQLRFAFDDLSYEKEFRRGMEALRPHISFSRIMIYVLIGFDTSLDDAIDRLNIINEYNADPFAMLFEKEGHDRITRELCRYVNTPICYRTKTFGEWLTFRNAPIPEGDNKKLLAFNGTRKKHGKKKTT